VANALAAESTVTPSVLVGSDALGEQARALVPHVKNLHGLVNALTQSGMVVDAVAAIAHSLPRPLVIAWVCACLRRVGGDESAQPGLLLAEQWLLDPGADNRQRAADYVEGRDIRSADDWLAAAVAWSGGSLAPPGYETVMPAPELTGRAAFAALCVAAERVPDDFAQELLTHVEQALTLFGSAAPRLEH
jgi:hypothetical protein